MSACLILSITSHMTLLEHRLHMLTKAATKSIPDTADHLAGGSSCTQICHVTHCHIPACTQAQNGLQQTGVCSAHNTQCECCRGHVQLHWSDRQCMLGSGVIQSKPARPTSMLMVLLQKAKCHVYDHSALWWRIALHQAVTCKAISCIMHS